MRPLTALPIMVTIGSLLASMKSRYQQWKLATIEKMLDLLSDFSEEPEDEETEESDEGEELSVKRY